MAEDLQSEGSKALDQREHHPDADAKKVVLVYQDPGDGSWYTYLPGDVPPSTATVTSVDDTASSTVLIAANADRKEVIIFNDSSSTLYVKLGTTASTTDYTVKLYTDDSFSTNYTGRIDGIWSANSTGAAKITALS